MNNAPEELVPLMDGKVPHTSKTNGVTGCPAGLAHTHGVHSR